MVVRSNHIYILHSSSMSLCSFCCRKTTAALGPNGWSWLSFLLSLEVGWRPCHLELLMTTWCQDWFMRLMFLTKTQFLSACFKDTRVLIDPFDFVNKSLCLRDFGGYSDIHCWVRPCTISNIYYMPEITMSRDNSTMTTYGVINRKTYRYVSYILRFA